ncbi:DUF1836 domain-containing protein [Mesobacillus zeae]|uniref:DUF1836 domain-containing protein n=1 Tax=Mesobacillus zeae TaxID=1917180 RepID=A0A398B3L0_9BACI|nr:DUF1836 domain-containing protein [Mesobacillus zeae]RID84455.1 DUF1836 domain-containing protein [Mesobacillus zeae]
MIEIEKLIDALDPKSQIKLGDIPEIDLYMDQVIQLFENNFKDTRRNEKDKLLTKTMINNYAKGKLFFPIKNKKYSKEHVILISLIYQLKGALSINDIKAALETLNEKLIQGNFDLGSYYEDVLSLQEAGSQAFKKGLQERAEEASSKAASEEDPYLEKLLLILSLANMSSLYRRAAEKLVDEISGSTNE